MTEIERYLRLATWGLWGAKKQEVHDELEEHILERAHHLQIFGAPPHEAIQRAIRELGPPERVGLAMNGVYHMPNLIKTTALATLLTTIGLSSITSSGAQVDVTSGLCARKRPASIQFSCDDHAKRRTDALDLQQLADLLRQQGVKVTPTAKHGLTLDIPGAPHSTQIYPDFQASDRQWAYVTNTLFALSLTGLPVHVHGWDNPTVNVGPASKRIQFAVGTPDTPLNAYHVYSSLFGQGIIEKLYGGRLPSGYGISAGTRGKRHVIQTGLPAGTVVGAAAPDSNHKMDFFVDTAVVASDGTAVLRLPWERVTFTTDLAALKQKQPASSPAAPAVLARVTGQVHPAGAQDRNIRIFEPQQEGSNAAQ